MKKVVVALILALCLFSYSTFAQEAAKPQAAAAAATTVAQPQSTPAQTAPAAQTPPAVPAAPEVAATAEYIVGVDDVLEVNILQPEKLQTIVTVAPDGSINFPYIGNVPIKGMSLAKVQEVIQSKLADGYMKYPVVSVALQQTRSKKFFVYGEVIKPGTYLIDENTTTLTAITMAGGFTKYGSANVKVLRPKKDKPGYDTIKVNIKAVMNGSSDADVVIQPGDIVVVSEGLL